MFCISAYQFCYFVYQRKHLIQTVKHGDEIPHHRVKCKAVTPISKACLKLSHAIGQGYQ